MAERRSGEFTAHEPADIAWAFATLGQQARMAVRHLVDAIAQGVANTAWAFTMRGQQEEQLLMHWRGWQSGAFASSMRRTLPTLRGHLMTQGHRDEQLSKYRHWRWSGTVTSPRHRV